jgi:hypothetical protein
MRLTLSFIGLALVAASVLSADSVTTFSSGFVVPESISAAPASFGLAPGSLVVVDLDAGTADSVSSHGGSPTALASFPPLPATPTNLASGVFAPNGNLIADGYYFNSGVGVIYSMSSATSTPQLVASSANTAFLGSAVAPTGFGSVAGDTLIVAAGSKNSILALSPAGTLSTFASLSTTGADVAFAPAGFIPGTAGPVLLVSDDADGNIYWIDSSGHEHLFATVPLTAGQTGLRQLAFAPSGFATASANYSGDLFVSVSGSAAGGGTFGSVDVLNSSGSLVAVLTQGAVGAPFDPRGLYFEGSNQLLIADADPSILSATPASFAPVPEPSVFGAMGLGLGVMVLLRRRSRG